MDLALIVLRLVVGLLFVGHGAQKLFGVFGGGGLEATAGVFDNIGLQPGWLHARAAGAAEFGGGALIALGLFTPFAAAVLIAVMTAAVITVHAPNGIWNNNQGYEFNLVLVAAVFALAGIGAGSWSLDNAFGAGRRRPRRARHGSLRSPLGQARAAPRLLAPLERRWKALSRGQTGR
jgi:putative oxidoreductase